MNGKAIGTIVAGVLLGIVALFALLGSWYIVDQGDRGVLLRNGKAVSVAQPGLNFKWPLIESVVKLSVRDFKKTYEKMTSYSKDIQLAELRVAVNWRVDASKVLEVYSRYQSIEALVDRVLSPRALDESKVVFGRFTAGQSIAERGRLGAEIEAAIREGVEGSGMIVTSVQLEEIDFSKEFEKSIEERMKAEVEVTKLQQNHEREKVQADIQRTQAKGEADKVTTVAKAEAEAIRLKGEAEASAIRARSAALQSNPALIELVKAERWDGKLPTTMLPGAGVPMVGLK